MSQVEHTPRFYTLLAWLNEQGPAGIQIKSDLLAEATGIPERSLHRHLKRMEELHLIVVDRPATLGGGREANIYRALVTAPTWRSRSQALLRTEEQKKKKAREAATKARRSQEAAVAQAAANAVEMRAILDTLDAPDPLIVELEQSVTKKMLGDPSDEDLIDAWLGGSL